MATVDYVPARAFIVHRGYATWHTGVVDTVTGRFAYYTYDHNRRVTQIAKPADYIRCERAR